MVRAVSPKNRVFFLISSQCSKSITLSKGKNVGFIFFGLLTSISLTVAFAQYLIEEAISVRKCFSALRIDFNLVCLILKFILRISRKSVGRLILERGGLSQKVFLRWGSKCARTSFSSFVVSDDVGSKVSNAVFSMLSHSLSKKESAKYIYLYQKPV